MLGLFLAGLLQATAAQGAAPIPPPRTEAESADMVTQFLFFRAQYFYDAAVARKCERRWPARTRAANARFESAWHILKQKFGARIDAHDRGSVDYDDADHRCKLGITLIGYENAIGELERNMAGTK
jgi:hypothetical protein